MIAQELPDHPFVGIPDATVLDADAFHEAIVTFIEQELPVWWGRHRHRGITDEPNLNQTLCLHLNSASRRQCFDAVQFLQEPMQDASRRADIGVFPSGTIMVEGRSYEDIEQLLPIECKRLPTPPDKKRSDCEYVHGKLGHRTGAIERFKHCLHGPRNGRAMIIGYVQSGTFDQWLDYINSRLLKLCFEDADNGLWAPIELLSEDGRSAFVLNRSKSRHRRINFGDIEILHLWLDMK